MSLEVLIKAIDDETQCINELLGYIVQQRDVVSQGNFAAMQDIMKMLHNASIEMQKCELMREKAASVLALELGCDKSLKSLCDTTGSEELRTAGDGLTKAVAVVSAESKILRRLIDEGQKFNEMMLSELRRFDGSSFPCGGGSMDLKG